MIDYMDRRVTPPKQVTSPTWGPHLRVNRSSEQKGLFEGGEESLKYSLDIGITLEEIRYGMA